MKRAAWRTALATFALASAVIATPAFSSVMTFDPITDPWYTEIHTYTEDGITLDAGTQHFHPLSDGSGGVAAAMFGIDGFPESITYNGGAIFDLASIDFLGFGDGFDAVLTSSSGASELISTAGTHTFGSGFKGIASATIDYVNFNIDSLGGFTLDNIVVQAASPVPEPYTWTMMLVGFAGAGMAMRRRRHLSRAPSDA